MTEQIKGLPSEAVATYRIATLGEWWGDKTLADVNGKTCRDYVTWRTKQKVRVTIRAMNDESARAVTVATARRELEDLRAAINYHRR